MADRRTIERIALRPPLRLESSDNPRYREGQGRESVELAGRDKRPRAEFGVGALGWLKGASSRREMSSLRFLRSLSTLGRDRLLLECRSICNSIFRAKSVYHEIASRRGHNVGWQ